MRKIKYFIIFVGLVLIVSSGVALYTRASFIDDTDFNVMADKINNFEVNFFPLDYYTEYDIYFVDIENYGELKDESHVILRVRLKGDRTTMYQTIFSQVEILDVYKGQELNIGDKIYIYEPSYISSHNVYNSVGAYNIMLDDNEYIVFLNELKLPPGYRKSDKQKISYTFVSPSYGKYPVKNDYIDAGEITDNIQEDVVYGEIKYNPIVTRDSKIIDKYKEFEENIQTEFIKNTTIAPNKE